MPETITVQPVAVGSLRDLMDLYEQITGVGLDVKWADPPPEPGREVDPREQLTGAGMLELAAGAVEVVRLNVPWQALSGALAVKLVEATWAWARDQHANHGHTVEVPIIGPDGGVLTTVRVSKGVSSTRRWFRLSRKP